MDEMTVILGMLCDEDRLLSLKKKKFGRDNVYVTHFSGACKNLTKVWTGMERNYGPCVSLLLACWHAPFAADLIKFHVNEVQRPLQITDCLGPRTNKPLTTYLK